MRRLVLSCRVERDRPEVINDAGLAVLEWAIRRLDGLRYAALDLSTAGGDPVRPDRVDAPEGIIIAGGRSGRVVVSHFINGKPSELWWLALPERGQGTEQGAVGGQDIESPARWWVEPAIAIRAAGHYLEWQQRDPGLTWEPDPGRDRPKRA
ncbi:MAG: hypothetical protein ACRDGQ_01775 [Candidatus Limnocylindrales bacterium]